MDVGEALQRLAVVTESRRWLGTPYHHRAGVRGAGCDCAYLLIRVFAFCGVAVAADPGFYKRGLAALRQGEKLYVDIVSSLAARRDTDRPLPGDVVLFRFARLTHGAIVEFWPYVIHAFQPAGRVVRSSMHDAYLLKRWESTWVPHAWGH